MVDNELRQLADQKQAHEKPCQTGENLRTKVQNVVRNSWALCQAGEAAQALRPDRPKSEEIVPNKLIPKLKATPPRQPVH